MTSLRQTPWKPLCELIELQLAKLDPANPSSFYMEVRLPTRGQYPYIQVSNFESDALMLELSSDRFLDEPLPGESKRILRSMGWNVGNGQNPKWHKSVKNTVEVGAVSDHLVITLRTALSMPITSWLRIELGEKLQGSSEVEGLEIDPGNPSIFRIQSP